MKLKSEKLPVKNETIRFRVTLQQLNTLQTRANLYTDGNLSAYLLYAGLNFVPGKEDFEEEKSRS